MNKINSKLMIMLETSVKLRFLRHHKAYTCISRYIKILQTVSTAPTFIHITCIRYIHTMFLNTYKEENQQSVVRTHHYHQ
jgi:hypothetical protein